MKIPALKHFGSYELTATGFALCLLCLAPNARCQGIGIMGDSTGDSAGTLLGTMHSMGDAVNTVRNDALGDLKNKGIAAGGGKYGNYCGPGWSNGQWNSNSKKKDVCNGKLKVEKVYSGGQKTSYRVFVSSNKTGWEELAPAKDDVDVGCLYHDVAYACSAKTGTAKTKRPYWQTNDCCE